MVKFGLFTLDKLALSHVNDRCVTSTKCFITPVFTSSYSPRRGQVTGPLVAEVGRTGRPHLTDEEKK
jgi:hypothetical protein